MINSQKSLSTKSFFRRFWWLLGIIFIILIGVVLIVVLKQQTGNQSTGQVTPGKTINPMDWIPSMSSKYPPCPAVLSGLLSAPLMDPKYIGNLIPLGNVVPPGHTAPMNRVLMAGTTYDGQIPLYAPADGWITQVEVDSSNDGTGKYVPLGFSLTFTICQGLDLVMGDYNDVVDDLKTALAQQTPNCTYGIIKPGHNSLGEGQCIYTADFPVKSGEQIGYVQTQETDEGLTIPFVVVAYNYNQTPRSDVNWSYYYYGYPYAFCLFDLYSGDLKDQYYSKFGRWDVPVVKDPATGKILSHGEGRLIPRTIPPLCGQINQDLVGTIQGMWFNGKPGENLEIPGKGLAFLHNNFDPTQAELTIGGTITDKADIITFLPTHSGTIDREPSEVKADGQVYCYNADQSNWRQISGKILVELLDDHHLKVENQSGSCGSNEVFQSPITYER